MGFYRVREGQEVGQSGVTRTGGDILDIPDTVGAELQSAGKVDPCDESGHVVVAPADQADLERQLARSRPHERVSLVQMEIDRLKKALEAAEARLADEQAKEKAGEEKASDPQPRTGDEKPGDPMVRTLSPGSEGKKADKK